MDNSSVILEDTARRSPDRDALVQGDIRTCTQMDAAAKQVANLDDSGARSYFCFQGTAERAMGAEGRAGVRRGRVCPREVEEVLMTHKDVSLAAVIGIRHKSHGEEVKAFVIRNEGAEITDEELVAWAKEQLASFKYPRVVEFSTTSR